MKLKNVGSMFDNLTLPHLGDTVWTIRNDGGVVSGTIALISNIDGRGFGNTYCDIATASGTLHAPINCMFDHRPVRATITDRYGDVTVWR